MAESATLVRASDSATRSLRQGEQLRRYTSPFSKESLS